MQTSSFIDTVFRQTGGAGTRAVLLSVTNQIQNFILGRDCPFMRVKPDPYFVTQDNVFNYVASNTLFDASDTTVGALVGDVRSVRRVYRIDTVVNTPNWFFPDGYYPFITVNPGEDPFFGDRGTEMIVKIACVLSRNPMSSDCLVKWPTMYPPAFSSQPTRFKSEAYLWPTQLLSENIPLTMPDEFCLSLLLNGVMEFMEQEAFGKSDWPSKRMQDQLIEFDSRYDIETRQDQVQTPGRVAHRNC